MFDVGIVFIGNVNGAKMQITKIENECATIKDLKTGKCFSYGIGALKKCNITILERL